MNSIILCEGRTDAILLSYYLSKVYGWKYSKQAPEKHFEMKAARNQEINWYKNGEHNLMIYGVGGKDNFKNVIDKYVSQILKNYTEEKTFKNLVIIADKDTLDISEIEKIHSEWLTPYVKKVVNSKWMENEFEDNFGNQQKIRTISIIIPTDRQGALETTLLEAISEEEYDKIIVGKCDAFIKDIRTVAGKYIKNDRLALKAHLSSVFSVLSPEKVFSQLDVIIREVPWEYSKTLEECFGILKEMI